MTPTQKNAHRRRVDRDRQRRYRARLKATGLPTAIQVAQAIAAGVRSAVHQCHVDVDQIPSGAPLNIVIVEAMLELNRNGYDMKNRDVRRLVRNAVTII